MNKLDQQTIKNMTMGCWWSSKAYPKVHPRWDMIADELRGLAEGEAFRGDDNRTQETLRLANLAKAEALK